MATSYLVLGQSLPAATTNIDIYTASVATVCSTLSICNLGTSTNVRVAVRRGGAALTNSQYIVYDNYVNQYDSIFLTLGITLASTDVVTVYSGSGNVAFSLFGSTIS